MTIYRILFAGRDTTGYVNLWITDGTSAGTKDLIVTGQYYRGLFFQTNGFPGFTVLDGKALFEGISASVGVGSTDDLWITDGTVAGTHKITVPGAPPPG